MKKIIQNDENWSGQKEIQKKSYRCGYCNDTVTSNMGLAIVESKNSKYCGGLYLCTNCGGPTIFTSNEEQYPGISFGNPIKNLSKELNDLYEEARKCSSENCYTAAVMICRKILMNIAVENKAKEGLKFIQYVEYLSDKNYIPPNGKQWVAYIKNKGNEANHEIKMMEKDDAEKLIIFVEMLLKFIYEFPAMIEKEDKNNDNPPAEEIKKEESFKEI